MPPATITVSAVVSRIAGRRARSAIWIEYFDFVSAFPPPFAVVLLVWSAAYIVGIA